MTKIRMPITIREDRLTPNRIRWDDQPEQQRRWRERKLSRDEARRAMENCQPFAEWEEC